MQNKLNPEHSRNLYRFIRLRLGQNVSDREIARRWGIHQPSFVGLKKGTKPVPAVHRIVSLARMLELDPATVFLASMGVPADELDLLIRQQNAERLLPVILPDLSREAARDPERVRFRTALDRVACAVFTIDLQTVFQDGNSATLRLCDRAWPDLAGTKLIDFVPEYERPAFLQALADGYLCGAISSRRICLQMDCGKTKTVAFQATRIDDIHGRAIGHQVVAQDLTDKLLAEAELARLLSKQDFDGAERRRHLRIPCSIPTSIGDTTGTITNLSRSGAFIECKPHERGTVVPLAFRLEQNGPLLELHADVAWSSLNFSAPNEGVGVRFKAASLATEAVRDYVIANME